MERTKKEYQTWFRQRGLKTSFPNKKKMIQYGQELTWGSMIPWRQEQRRILRAFQQGDWNEIVIQAIFGGGKTTMMLALVYDLILHQKCRQTQIFICAFNCAIKNEIRKKTKRIGKLDIRTYDSLIYQLCSEMKFSNLKALNFETKRRFVVEHLDQIPSNDIIRYVFVDEAQDLEISCLSILRKRFSQAKFMIVGDNFQSIQKEPRESILWYLLQEPYPTTRKVFKMTETPRVPQGILEEIRGALQLYYPEFQQDIEQWKSSNSNPMTSKIEWKTFDQYSTMYKEILDLLRHRFLPSDTMILTFSSAVTVRGTLGDVARFRRMFLRNGIEVNMNHKQMKDHCLFLTTSNSSKGLERRHVIAILTFPLEMAFSNFSDDLVMNLITVASSRTKESLIFYVPSFQDRFSKVLNYFEQCPRPIKISSPTIGPVRKSTPFYYNASNPFEMLQKEHSVTELLRQSILSFELRHDLLEYIRHRETFSLNTSIENLLTWKTEEDCAFIGVLFETLVLTSWTHQWPSFSLEEFRLHEIFQGHWSTLVKIHQEYTQFQQRYPSPSVNEEIRFQGCCQYAQLHLFAYHKILMDDWTPYQSLISFWKNSRTSFMASYSIHQPKSLKTQCNISMPFVTGIMDAVVETESSFDILEIKASRSLQWKTQALLQAILYGILSAKSIFKIHLINVFAKQTCTFSLFLQKDLMKLRTRILQEILNWNFNCFLSKNRISTIQLSNLCLMDGRFDSSTQEWTEISCLYFLSDTKARLHIWTNDMETSPLSSFQSSLSTYQSFYPFKSLYVCPRCELPSTIQWKRLERPSLEELMQHYPTCSMDWTRSYHTLVFYATSLYFCPLSYSLS